MRRLRRGPAALLAVALWTGGAAAAGTIQGSVHSGVEGVDAADAGPVVVFLERLGSPLEYPVPSEVPRIRQRHARFEPPFLAVPAGTRVEMPNDDVIFHNVFSYSTPNDFDLGTYPGGASRKVQMRYAGVVRIYCSIHESMNATIFIAPSPLFAVTSVGGSFAIENVPAGRYRLRAWAMRMPRAVTEIELAADDTLTVGLTLAAEEH